HGAPSPDEAGNEKPPARAGGLVRSAEASRLPGSAPFHWRRVSPSLGAAAVTTCRLTSSLAPTGNARAVRPGGALFPGEMLSPAPLSTTSLAHSVPFSL